MSSSICWELTCDGLVSHPGGVKDPHALNTTETGDKRRLYGPLGSKRISFLVDDDEGDNDSGNDVGLVVIAMSTTMMVIAIDGTGQVLDVVMVMMIMWLVFTIIY